MATKRELTFLMSDFKRYLTHHRLAILCERAVNSQHRPHIPLVLRDALPRYNKGANIPQGSRSSNRSSCRGFWGQTLPSLGPFSSQVGAPTPGSDPKPSGNPHRLFAKPPNRQRMPKIKVSPSLPETQCPGQGQIRLPPYPGDISSLWDHPQLTLVPSITLQCWPQSCPRYRPSCYFLGSHFGFALWFCLLSFCLEHVWLLQ